MVDFDFQEYDALIFDMDGTLVDNMDFHRQTWIEWAKREQLNMTPDEVWAQTHGTIEEIMARLFPDRSPQEQFEIGERKEALYRELYAPHLAPIQGLYALLDWAKEHGIPCAVATAGNTTNINFTIDGLGIRSYFQTFVGGNDVTNGKPDPEVFLKAAQWLGVNPEKCLVFEDSIVGVEAARRAGMKCVALNLMNPREAFGETSHVVRWVDDYRDLVLLEARD